MKIHGKHCRSYFTTFTSVRDTQSQYGHVLIAFSCSYDRRRRGASRSDSRVTCAARMRRRWSAETGSHVAEEREEDRDEQFAVYSAAYWVSAAVGGVAQ